MFHRSSFDDHVGVRVGPSQPVRPDELLRDDLPGAFPPLGPPLLLASAGKLDYRRSGKHLFFRLITQQSFRI
jgi:hypothetical protein